MVLKKHNLDPNKKYISIVPGSRESEIKYMLKTYIEFIKDHSQETKDYIYLLPAADGKLMMSITKSFDGLNLPIVIKENAK